jgi:hypothetical protein
MTTYRDPRLADPLLLALAGQRLLHRQAQPPAPSWPPEDGLSNLLAYARHLPPCDPQDIPGVVEGAPGMAGLLWECRQVQQEPGHEA